MVFLRSFEAMQDQLDIGSVSRDPAPRFLLESV